MCADPDPGKALNLSTGDVAGLLPLRPYQCVVLFHDTLLMVNNGNIWIDNVYLKVAKWQARPTMSFISIGGEIWEALIKAGQVFITRVTFQPDGQGTTNGISADISDASVLIHGVTSVHLCLRFCVCAYLCVMRAHACRLHLYGLGGIPIAVRDPLPERLPHPRHCPPGHVSRS